MVLKPSPIRAALAWVGACFVGACIGVLGIATANVVGRNGAWISAQDFMMVSGAFFFGSLIITAPLSLLAIVVIRMTGIRRPWADTVAGAAIAVIGAMAPEILLYGRVTGESSLPPFALMAGLIAGPIYWCLAGKPRPRTSSDQPTAAT